MLTDDKKFEVTFKVIGAPVGKARPRFTRTGHTYTPAKSKNYEKKIAQEAWVAMANKKLNPTECSVHLEMDAYLPVPVSWSKKKQNQARMGALRPSKPDIDNIIKAILDGCNKVIYNDDAQVHSIRARKLYETYENPPSIDVKVSWV